MKDNLKEINGLFWPIVIALISSSILGFIDKAMISQYDLNALSAINIADQSSMIFGPIYFAILTGVNIFSVQFFARGEIKKVKYLFYYSVRAIMVFGTIHFIIAFFFAGPFIDFFISPDDAINTMAYNYLKITAFCAFLMPIDMLFMYQYRAIKKPKIPLYIGLSQAVLNIILNYIFIFVLDHGVVGAALATLISRIVFVIINIIIASKVKAPFISHIKNIIVFDKEMDKEVFKKSLPLIIVEFGFGLSKIIYTKIYTLTGIDQFNAMQVANLISFMLNGFVMGTASVSGILIGRALTRTKAEVESMLKSLYIFISICAGSILFLSIVILPFVIKFFSVDTSMFTTVYILIVLNAIFMAGRVFNSSNLAIMKSGGVTKPAMFADAGITFVVGIPLTIISYFIFPSIVFMKTVILAESATRLFVTFAIIRKRKWQKEL